MVFQRVVVLAVWLSFCFVDGLSLSRDATTGGINALPVYSTSGSCQSRFLGGMPSVEAGQKRRRSELGASLRMDLEEGLYSYERQLLRRVPGGIGAAVPPAFRYSCAENDISLTTAEAEARDDGMPWKRSIASYTPPSVPSLSGTSPLLFMPFWIEQIDFLKNNLTNLRPVEVEEDISYKENSDGDARIVNHCYSSDEYHRIRCTYYDAGDKCQVFNSLWYPHPRYGNLPVLGIDLLAFNRRAAKDSNGDVRGKYLSVIDFQPVHKETNDIVRFSNAQLGSIRTDYESLQGTMSNRFYDHTRHFSPSMLYGRCESEGFVATDLAPAFQRSMQAHLNLLKRVSPDDNESSLRQSLEGQAAYDCYSSVRDPAKALFSKMFGVEWADKYVFDFLFELSDEESVKKEEMIMKSQRRRDNSVGV